MNERLEKGLTKSLSFVPLPILDVVLRGLNCFKRSRRRSQARKRSSVKKVQVKQLDPTDPYSPWFRAGKPPRTNLTDVDSIDSIIWRVLSQYGSRLGMGWRRVICKTNKVMPDGSVRVERTYEDKYTWLTFFEIASRMANIKKGLCALGVKRPDCVAVLMESRVERKIMITAIMRSGAIPALVPPDRRPLATFYMINQLDSAVLIMSAETAAQLPVIAPQLSHTRTVIIVEDEVNDVKEPLQVDVKGLKNIYEEPIEVMTLSDLEALGQRSAEPEDFASHPDDAAFVVFTSGSTGASLMPRVSSHHDDL